MSIRHTFVWLLVPMRAMWMLEVDYGVLLPNAMSEYGALDESDLPTSEVEEAYERDIREAAERWLAANPRT